MGGDIAHVSNVIDIGAGVCPHRLGDPATERVIGVTRSGAVGGRHAHKLVHRVVAVGLDHARRQRRARDAVALGVVGEAVGVKLFFETVINGPLRQLVYDLPQARLVRTGLYSYVSTQGIQNDSN